VVIGVQRGTWPPKGLDQYVRQISRLAPVTNYEVSTSQYRSRVSYVFQSMVTAMNGQMTMTEWHTSYEHVRQAALKRIATAEKSLLTSGVNNPGPSAPKKPWRLALLNNYHEYSQESCIRHWLLANGTILFCHEHNKLQTLGLTLWCPTSLPPTNTTSVTFASRRRSRAKKHHMNQNVPGLSVTHTAPRSVSSSSSSSPMTSLPGTTIWQSLRNETGVSPFVWYPFEQLNPSPSVFICQDHDDNGNGNEAVFWWGHNNGSQELFSVYNLPQLGNNSKGNDGATAAATRDNGSVRTSGGACAPIYLPSSVVSYWALRDENDRATTSARYDLLENDPGSRLVALTVAAKSLARPREWCYVPLEQRARFIAQAETKFDVDLAQEKDRSLGRQMAFDNQSDKGKEKDKNKLDEDNDAHKDDTDKTPVFQLMYPREITLTWDRRHVALVEQAQGTYLIIYSPRVLQYEAARASQLATTGNRTMLCETVLKAQYEDPLVNRNNATIPERTDTDLIPPILYDRILRFTGRDYAPFEHGRESSNSSSNGGNEATTSAALCHYDPHDQVFVIDRRNTDCQIHGIAIIHIRAVGEYGWLVMWTDRVVRLYRADDINTEMKPCPRLLHGAAHQLTNCIAFNCIDPSVPINNHPNDRKYDELSDDEYLEYQDNNHDDDYDDYYYRQQGRRRAREEKMKKEKKISPYDVFSVLEGDRDGRFIIRRFQPPSSSHHTITTATRTSDSKANKILHAPKASSAATAAGGGGGGRDGVIEYIQAWHGREAMVESSSMYRRPIWEWRASSIDQHINGHWISSSLIAVITINTTSMATSTCQIWDMHDNFSISIYSPPLLLQSFLIGENINIESTSLLTIPSHIISRTTTAVAHVLQYHFSPPLIATMLSYLLD
jgi:hypothetical protein